MTRFLKVFLGLGLSLAPFTASLSAQAGGGSVSSTYSLGSATFGAGGVQYNVAITIEYGQGLMPGQYISQSQLTTDFQNFLNIYPNAGDPPEAILLSAVNGFASKYSQFSVVSLGAGAGTGTGTGLFGGFSAEISATASNLQLPGGYPTGLTDSMRRAMKAHK